MMKRSFIILSLLLLLTATGCFGSENKESVSQGKGEQTETTSDNNEISISSIEEVSGTESIYDRFLGSVRTNHVEGSFSIFVAEATIEDVLAHYQKIANEIGVDWFYEQLPEDQPHWVTAYVDNAKPEAGGFAFTLGEAEDICDGCVSWVFYTKSWEN